MVRIPAVDTMADLIERLIIIDNRMAWLEQQKRDLNGKDPETIAKLDLASRDCCEGRSATKNRINQVFEEIANGEEYRAIRESRSFRPPFERFSEVLDKCSSDLSAYFVSDRFARSIRSELLGDPASQPARG
jgi:hypothetical protein